MYVSPLSFECPSHKLIALFLDGQLRRILVGGFGLPSAPMARTSVFWEVEYLGVVPDKTRTVHYICKLCQNYASHFKSL